jgi:hypothetical protein
MRNAHKILAGKPERKRLFERRRQVIIEMDLREVWWGGVGWIHLAQGRNQWWALVNTVMNLRAHKGRGIS